MVVGDVGRRVALNEQELWREMVRWSGGVIVEDDGLLLVSGPSSYLRVAIRTDARVDGASVVRRATQFFAEQRDGFIVLVRDPDDADVMQAALAAGFAPGWTERPMAITIPPDLRQFPEEIEIREVADSDGVRDYGLVVGEANDDPGERERAGLLFHDETILAPHLAAVVAYLDERPVACAMTLVSHGIAGVFYVATIERVRRRGLGDALTRLTANAGFRMGAQAAWLGASQIGAGMYRRIGFTDLGSTIIEYESPQDIAG